MEEYKEGSYIQPIFSDYVEIRECPKCNSKNIKWHLSSTKECKDCGAVFRAEEIVSKNPNHKNN